MGFGILFLGYLLTFGSAFFTMYLFGDIVGCAVMIGAFVMLSQYCKMFKYAISATGVLCSFYVFAAALRMMGYGTPAENEVLLRGERLYSLLQYVLPVVTMGFYFVLLLAIAKLATDVELPDLAKRSYTYIKVYSVYFGMWVLFNLLDTRIAAASVRVYNVTAAGLALFNGVWLIMMVVHILSCLKWIVPEEQAEAEQTGDDSADGLLTRIGDRLNKIQEKARTPREKKEEERLRRELDRPAALPENNAEESEDSGEK